MYIIGSFDYLTCSITGFMMISGPLLSSQKWFTNRLVGNNISNVLEFGQVITKETGHVQPLLWKHFGW